MQKYSVADKKVFKQKKKKKNSFAYSSTRSSPFQLIVIRWYDLFHAGCNGWWTKFRLISGWGDQSFVEAGLDDEKMPKLTMEMRSRDSSLIQTSSNYKMVREFRTPPLALTKLPVQMSWNLACMPLWAKLEDSSRRFLISALEAEKMGVFMFWGWGG